MVHVACGCSTTIIGTHTGHTIHSSGTTLGTGIPLGYILLGTGMTHGTTATTDIMADTTADITVATMAITHTIAIIAIITITTITTHL